MNTRMKEVKNTKDIDLLFIGSSHAYRGFDNRIFEEKGYTTFNLGSSSQTPIQTKTLLTRYLSQLNPKHVVYEVYPELFQSDGVESSLDLISNDHVGVNTLSMAIQVNHLKTYNTLLYGFLHEQVFGLETNEPKIKGKDTYISGGFVEKDLYSFLLPAEKKEKIKISPKKNQLNAFKDIVQTILERNIKLTVVFTPITDYHYESYVNLDKFDSLMNTIDKFDYYDFNKFMNFSDSAHFYDSHHLNQNGVVKFNKRLLEQIITNKRSRPTNN